MCVVFLYHKNYFRLVPPFILNIKNLGDSEALTIEVNGAILQMDNIRFNLLILDLH